MPRRDPFKYPYPKGFRRLADLEEALNESNKRPPVGVTQGGSSRKDRGAKVAATTAQHRPSNKRGL